MRASSAYRIFKLAVEKAGQIVPLSYMLPKHLLRCVGFKVTSDTVSYQRSFDPGRLLGWLTLELNSRASGVASYPVYSDQVVGEHFGYQPLNTLLETQLVTGYFIDKHPNGMFSPYSISVYLHCKAPTALKPW